MGRLSTSIAAVAVVLAACGGGDGASDPPPAGVTTSAPTTTAAPSTTSAPTPDGALPRCDQVPPRYAEPGEYAAMPMYFANEMPIDTIEVWAKTLRGFEAIWIDRQHNGWITVAFSEGADVARDDLDLLFPDVGVVVVEVPWTRVELETLRDRANAELREVLPSFAIGVDFVRGVVDMSVGPLTDEVLEFLEDRFGGERVCVSGIDPDSLPPPGPQPEFGVGWRLLADAPRVGQPYRTGIATDAASLAALWDTIGLSAPLPQVEFTTEVVIWFGAVFSGSCPEIRLDDVVVDGDTVYAEIVQVGWAAVCTDDANPRAYVVAVERTRLPAGPLVIQLGAATIVPEERTVVEADLSQPGAVPTPDQIHGDLTPPPPPLPESGAIIEPDYPVDYRLDARCGVTWLGEVNFYNWTTSAPIPPEWESLVADDGSIVVSLLLRIDPAGSIAATAGGVTLTYRPTNDTPPPCN